MDKSAAVITGAAGGLGQSLCRIFRNAGYQVVGMDILSGAEHCDMYVRSDLRELCRSSEYRESVRGRILESVSGYKLSVLINNAAIQIVKPTGTVTPEDWQETLDVNLVAPFLLSQMLLAELEDAKGSIINVSSIHATLTKPEFICYATSKAAIVGLTRSMAVDLGSRVRVNAICPAAVATPMLLAGFEGKKKELSELSMMHPLERIAEPEEIAKVALFLSSSQASFITGTAINVDGGIGSRLHDPI